MLIEVNLRRDQSVAENWGCDPNLRAEIKREIAEAMGRILRTKDLVEWRVEILPSGGVLVRGFLNVSRPGDGPDYVLELNPEGGANAVQG